METAQFRAPARWTQLNVRVDDITRDAVLRYADRTGQPTFAAAGLALLHVGLRTEGEI